MTEQDKIEQLEARVARQERIINAYRERMANRMDYIQKLWEREKVLRRENAELKQKLDLLSHPSKLQNVLDSILEMLWDELGDIPIDEDECIEEEFHQFETGTHRETIWHWFDKHHSKGVAEGLMYKGDK